MKMYGGLILHRYLRIVPVYYFLFLFGWLVGPSIGGGPCWLTYEKGFNDCKNYWWSVFTMTINFFPWYTIANEGCFFWGWVVACEMQIFIFLPLIVALLSLLSTKWRAFNLLLMLSIGIAVNFYIIWKNNLAVALFNPNDLTAVMYFVNKPYTKIHAVANGIALGFIF